MCNIKVGCVWITIVTVEKQQVLNIMSGVCLLVEHYRQQIEEKLNHVMHTEQDNGEELWER